MNNTARKLAPLLFGSGTCALVYQIAWFREFRMMFGASTAANAAVLAIFIGGLGAGGLVLGKRVDRHPRPVLFYGQLEGLIALSAAFTPLLLHVARWLYAVLGGTPRLGLLGGTITRLILATFVLAIPTFLMGGTLPAAARGAEADDDDARRSTGLLYGINTLGSVTGCTLSTFWLLEAVGTRCTIWLAGGVNLLVASGAILFGLRAAPLVAGQGASPTTDDASRRASAAPAPTPASASRPAPVAFSLAAALAVGFAFFLMEMVWYRMLGPILGGTVFTFGLILAIALLGIGLGGAFYGFLGAKRPATLLGFAYTCLLEAAFVVLPYALGDRIAALTLALRPVGVFGFAGLLGGWTAITLVVVLPAAFVSGVQFPMLIALLGRGRENVGQQIGLTYAFNTVGAIAGSLAGGFGLMPALTAPGCWRLVTWVLTGLGLVAVGLVLRSRRGVLTNLARVAIPVGLATACFVMGRAIGPTAVWRHSPIGVGRVDADAISSSRSLRSWMNDERRAIVWEAEGVESTVALNVTNGWAFVVNGKIDGNARGDASTQVMGGLVGAILHPNPTNAMVIGLGTGSTAGWLGSIPSMTKIDVVEFEPVIRSVARTCVRVNQNVMDNPKVHVTIGDAREVLITTPERYDIIFSEPSNPYRAGIASLFTREYYEAIAARLREGGVMLQWVQAYNVDAQAVRTIYATLASVFPHIETWELAVNDLLLVASQQPIVYDATKMRQRIAEEPFRTALASTWRAVDLEGFFAHYVARSDLAHAIAEAEHGRLNTDDRTLVEFGFARMASDQTALSSSEIRQTAHERYEDRPERLLGEIDFSRVEDEWVTFLTTEESQDDPPAYLSTEQKARQKAQSLYLEGQWAKAVSAWKSQPREPAGPTEVAVLAESLANIGDERALRYIEQLRAWQPAEADVILARLLVRQRKLDEAVTRLERALLRYRQDVWPWPVVMRHAFDTIDEIATLDARPIEQLYDAVSTPFVAYVHEDRRVRTMLRLARQHPLRSPCADTLRAAEPNVPWEEDLLRWRSKCYEAQNDALALRAKKDLADYLAQEPAPFQTGLAETITSQKP